MELTKLQQETAFLKGSILDELKEEAPRTAKLDEGVRVRLLEAVADEVLDEAMKGQRWY